MSRELKACYVYHDVSRAVSVALIAVPVGHNTLPSREKPDPDCLIYMGLADSYG